MKRFDFIMGLRRAYDYFVDQKCIAEESVCLEYLRFLKTLGFYDLVEQVITACAMYPRSIEACRDNLQDLSYGLLNDLGIGRFFLSNANKENLAELIMVVGNEVISTLSAHGYYYQSYQLPRGWEDDPHFATDLTSVVGITKINNFTFKVKINECHFDEIGDLSTKTGGHERPHARSF